MTTQDIEPVRRKIVQSIQEIYKAKHIGRLD